MKKKIIIAVLIVVALLTLISLFGNKEGRYITEPKPVKLGKMPPSGGLKNPNPSKNPTLNSIIPLRFFFVFQQKHWYNALYCRITNIMGGIEIKCN